MRELLRQTTVKLGKNKGAPRVWIEGRYLLDAGFACASRIEADFQPGRITLRLAENGRRVVSGKRGGTLPVIDINSSALREAFGTVETVQVEVFTGEIILTPVLREQKRRTRCRNGQAGSIFGGTGLLAKAAELAGFRPRFVIEMDESYANNYALNFPGATVYNMPIEEVPINSLPGVELLEIGLPCEAFAICRRTERGTKQKRDQQRAPESHPTGSLTVWAAMVIEAINPAHVVIECAAEYLTSGAGFIMRTYLERAGYKVDTRTLKATDYGELQIRERTVIVATDDDGEPVKWPKPFKSNRLLGDILDAPDEVEAEWFTEDTKAWIFRHSREQKAKGNNFGFKALTALSRECPAIKRRYLSGQGDNPVVTHPTRPECYRFFTLSELRRLFGVPDDFILPENSKTKAGEMLGQGVIVSLFTRIIKAATGRAPAAECETGTSAAHLTTAEPAQFAFAF